MDAVVSKMFGPAATQGPDIFDLEKVIQSSGVIQPGYSTLVLQLSPRAIGSLPDTQKIATVCCISDLSDRVAKEGPSILAFPWESLQRTFAQATYLEYDRTSPTAPQSWEATSIETHWLRSSAPSLIPDPRIIQKLLLDITSRQDDGPGCVDSLGYLRRLFAGSTGDGGAVRTDTKEREQWNRVLVEIKVLKFPDSKDARFTISRLRVFAWMCNERHYILPRTVTETGITIEHFASHFFPREEVIERLSSEAQDQALKQVDTLIHALEAEQSKMEQIPPRSNRQHSMAASPARTQPFVAAANQASFDVTRRNEDTESFDRSGGLLRTILGRPFSLLCRAVGWRPG